MQNNLDKYLFEVRSKLEDKLQDQDFIGKISFEINIKCGGIVNMNIDHRESVKV